MQSQHTTEEEVQDNKFVIYQLLVRLFGNQNSTNKTYGSKEENGVGKFNDITDTALAALKDLGATHLWYTGVLEHATMTDYSLYGIAQDDPDVVKGKAGSPYAIKDYYDVDPDLARDIQNRMAEFKALVRRTHQHGLKVIIDFVPNHVARVYKSDSRPPGVRDLGADDDKTKAFSPRNDFYYIPGVPFRLPYGTNAGGPDFKHPLKDYHFQEVPAKATGNDVFSATPRLEDWYETVKLNYGVDYLNHHQTYFDPIPPLWLKMRDILDFWARKQVDGFRCDMAEMVPVEFWNWVIPEIRKSHPHLIFIAEAYNPWEYSRYFNTGKFDFMYDKVGLYDGLRPLIRHEDHAHVGRITHVWKEQCRGFSSRMLRFLENHDEERIASAGFARNPWYAKAAMVVSATLSSGPVLIYFGQEVGEPARGHEGFSGEDNRTTIFDYWGVPEHQKWMNGGKFDGGLLSPDQRRLRSFYRTLLRAVTSHEAIRAGRFYELHFPAGFNHRQYAFLRFTPRARVLVVANFDRYHSLDTTLHFPDEVRQAMGLELAASLVMEDLLSGSFSQVEQVQQGIKLHLAPTEALLLSF